MLQGSYLASFPPGSYCPAPPLLCAGHLLFASALPGSLYVGSLIVGTCYGAQWTLMPAIASELFGLARFGAILNWQQVAIPTGSYILSVLVAGYLYDREAEKEHRPPQDGGGLPPQRATKGDVNADARGSVLQSGANSGGPTTIFRTRLLESGASPSINNRQRTAPVEIRSGGGSSWIQHVLRTKDAGTSREGTSCTGSHCFRLTFIIMAGVCIFGVLLNIWLALRTREYYRGIWKEHADRLNRKERTSRTATEEDRIESGDVG